jgi:Spy/CpxP family protein refolding chaperone
MRKFKRMLVVAGAALALSLGAGNLAAQNGPPGGGGPGGRGNFDPAQFQQRMMERMKEQLEVTDDTEWKAIEPLVQKVMEARRDAMSGMMGGRGMFGRGPRPGGDNAAPNGGNQNRRRGMFGGPSPEAEALQKAIDAKASNAELKSTLDKYVASRKEKQAALQAAQDELRKVLTPRQEAIATLDGLL